MEYSLSRRKLLGTTAAGMAAAVTVGTPSVTAQQNPTIGVGSHNFTEQIILGEMLSQLLESRDFPVDQHFNLGGSFMSHEALMNGDIETYVEYTGSGLIAILGMDIPEREESPDEEISATPVVGDARAQQVYNIVSEAYAEEFNVEWLEPWGFNNTYILAMRREYAEELGVTKVSELEPLADDLSIGSDAEGMVREDGVAGLEDAYGFEFGNKVLLDVGLMYPAVADGEVDVITAFSTDGRIESMGLVTLEDDLGFFPPYFAAPVVRMDTLEESPEVRDILNQLAGRIDNARMMEMNYLADGEGIEPAEIVRGFLIEEGVIEDE